MGVIKLPPGAQRSKWAIELLAPSCVPRPFASLLFIGDLGIPLLPSTSESPTKRKWKNCISSFTAMKAPLSFFHSITWMPKGNSQSFGAEVLETFFLRWSVLNRMAVWFPCGGVMLCSWASSRRPSHVSALFSWSFTDSQRKPCSPRWQSAAHTSKRASFTKQLNPTLQTTTLV